MDELKPKGVVYWFVGLSGSGKTTLANKLYNFLHPELPNLVILDGDHLRSIFEHDFGYTQEQRKKNSFRNARLCKALSDQGIHVICPTIAPFEEVCEWNRKNISTYYEIFLDVPLDVLGARDTKGLYSVSAQNPVKNVVGIDIPFEAPSKADLVIQNYGDFTPQKSMELLLQLVLTQKFEGNRDSFA